MTENAHPFRVDRKLRINITAAIIIIIICPLALWQFYFRYENAKDKKPGHVQLIANYCRSYNKPVFHSAEVFASSVERYMGAENITPVDIDHMVAIDRQTNMYPRISFIEKSNRDSVSGKNQPMAIAWLREVIYVKPKMEYRLREVNVQFTYDDKGKIVAFDTLGTRGTVFTREMPK